MKITRIEAISLLRRLEQPFVVVAMRSPTGTP